MDLNRQQFKMDFHGRPLVLEVSRLAEQATSSVLGRYGDTALLITVVWGKNDREIDYFPLTVDYEERFYAAGKIYGSRFIRRESRPSEEAILSARVVDRTIRPLFDHRMRKDVQVVVTILSIDEENDPDFLALLSASTALAISEIPWNGPVAGVKILKTSTGAGQALKNEIIINPLNSQIKENFEFVSFIAGTGEKINMIELEGIDAKEENIIEAFELAKKEISQLIQFQKEIIKKVGAPKAAISVVEIDPNLKTKVNDFLKDKLEAALYTKTKQTRESQISKLKLELFEYLKNEGFNDKDIKLSGGIFEEEINTLIHKNILEFEKRPDGRKLDELRDLYAEVGLFKRTHGSALFVRGTTQALAVTTLAAPGAEQLIETIEFTGKRRFMLHYNFPPYCSGEIGPFRGPGRREIGHGALAEKALKNLIPPQDLFPYTIRSVSEILSSNGSTSMATVSAVSLALMDAGVPIKKPAAGIAMGLMLENKQPTTDNQQLKYKILTDIQGPEDHHGDMDCKIAGTRDGITAMQMDVKIEGLTTKILADVLAQGKKARLEILDFTDKILSAPRKEISTYAPFVLTLDINPLKIGEVIGPGGKTINSIIEKTGALSIDIDRTGKVYIAGSNKETAVAAFKEVESITKEYQVGEIVEGDIVKILDFGAIVQIGPNREGMIHISELKEGYVKKVEDVVKLGDRVRAKIIRVEDGKIGLSLKVLANNK